MSIEDTRNEMLTFLNKNVYPILENEKDFGAIKEKVKASITTAFPLKFFVITKKYEDTIRISTRSPALGILFFFTYTPKDKKPYVFSDLSYEIKGI